MATLVIWLGSGLLESSSERLSAYYELPPIVQGAIVVAVGSSFPELSTTVLSTWKHGKFELGVSAIVGSAIFNILVIPGLSGLFAKGEYLEANRDLVYKEAQFYMNSVAVLLLTFAFAVIYNPVPSKSGAIQGTLTPWLAAIPVVLYLLYLFVQWQDTMDYESSHKVEDVSPVKEWFTLAASLAIILVGVEMLVHAALGFGDYFGTPSFLWGVTVVAAGTSIPDAFVSVRAAQQGNTVTCLANVLGSNIFDLLICIPVGVFIAGSTVVDFTTAAPMMAALTLATLLLFMMMRTGMKLTRTESWILLISYVLFVVWITLETFQVIDLVPSLPPGV